MTFGLRSGERAAATLVPKRRGGGAVTMPALLGTIAALSLLAGCGGGGGGGGGGGNNTSNATITGTVVDPQTNNSADTDVVVAFGSLYTITSSSGSFSLSIPQGTAGSVIFYGKAARDSSGNLIIGSNGLPTSVSTQDGNTYEGEGYYPASSKTQINLFTSGRSRRRAVGRGDPQSGLGRLVHLERPAAATKPLAVAATRRNTTNRPNALFLFIPVKMKRNRAFGILV